jgi:cysteine desulfurase/selenocysteine lyase
VNTRDRAPLQPLSEPGAAFSAQIALLANELFAAARPDAVSPIVHREPSALGMGGGASPTVLTSGVPSPLAASPLDHSLPDAALAGDLPGGVAYFLELSGFPSASSMPAPPSVPASPAVAPVPASPAFDSSLATRPPAASLPTGAGAPTTFDTVLPGSGDLTAPATDLPRSRGVFDPHAVKRDFPILSERVNGHPLVWLDNGATTQKPRSVLERLRYFYEHENSNIHRAAHTLAGRATDAYEAARDKVRRFLNAPSAREIVFVRGGTEAINLVAQSFGRRYIGAGDEIVVTALEHHANIVPWQLLAKETGARLRVVPVDDTGQVLLEDYERLLGPRTRLVSLTHVSNALGTVVPVREMTAMAHRYGARVLLDGAQAVSHLAVDVQALDCDFYCFSGHKVFAPTGIGALFGKADVLEAMPPWQGGGNMINDVTFERTSYQPPPARFEAGTGNIADAVGLGAAIDYVTAIGLDVIGRYEHELLVYATERLNAVPGLKLVGTAPDKAGVLSFVLAGQRTEDVGAALDQEGIAVRSGHHCAQPILRRFGLEATVRATLALYNTRDDIDALVAALFRLQVSYSAPTSPRAPR